MNSFASRRACRTRTGVGGRLELFWPAQRSNSMKAGKPYVGKVQVLGTRYIGDYEPITDASGAVIGACFVGYKK